MTARAVRTADIAALLWVAALVAMAALWLQAPDIEVTEGNGSGCGRWNAAENALHREQMGMRLLPTLVAATACAVVWFAARYGRDAARFVAVAAVIGTAVDLLMLWQPAHAGFVWVQLLGLFLSPLWAALVIALVYRARRRILLRARLVGAAAPVLVLGLVVTTRVPWIWTC